MGPYDPYKALLTELRDGNDWAEETLVHDLNSARQQVRQLRFAYRQSPSNVDFGNPYVRDAYLLAYYPKYTEPLSFVLHSLPPDFSDFFQKTRVRACFLGAGPAPEVIGWIRYLNESESIATHAHAYLLDQVISGWHKGHEITRYHVAPLYWNGKLVISAHQFDFCAGDLQREFEKDPFIDQAFCRSELFVMQNCINDQLGSRDSFMANLLAIFEKMTPRSLFIIIDLDFQDVLTFIKEFQQTVIDKGLGNVVRPVQDTVEKIRASIIVPEIVKRELFHPYENGLILSTRVKFRYSILERLERVDALPF